jgi:hypothetical protein
MELRIVIVSDLHAFAASDLKAKQPSPSHLNIALPEDQPTRHPIAGLMKLIEELQLKADLLLCPGDMGDRASREGIQYAWKKLHELKERLDAKFLATATGNHDVDSRGKHSTFDPLDILKNLVPPYPFADDSSTNEYWAAAFSVTEFPACRLVTLNSSAYHGNTTIEKNHGRITDLTLSKIERYLRGRKPKPVNLLLCHHHPQQHSELGLGEYDTMHQGQQLLDLLGSGSLGRWLVVHGHKHHPKLTYAAGSSSSPVVFSAGSLSAILYAELGTAARNQFYELTFDLNQISRFGPVGRGRSWYWASARGWLPAPPGSGLPAHFGFGWREDPLVLATRFAPLVKPGFTPWDEFVNAAPEVAFLAPGDLEQFIAELKGEHSINVTRDSDNSPVEVGREI